MSHQITTYKENLLLKEFEEQYPGFVLYKLNASQNYIVVWDKMMDNKLRKYTYDGDKFTYEQSYDV
jgi:hypothetical protein